MSTEQGAETEVAQQSTDEVRGISDLVQRLTTPYLRNSTLYRCVVVALGVLAGICLIATAVRLSPLPLIPLPVLGVAAYSLRRIRTVAESYRSLLTWWSVLAATVLVGFWLISVVGRWVS